MEIIIYGKVLQERYIIDWHWDDRNDYEDILNNTEKYLITNANFIRYEQVKDVINDDHIRVVETKIGIKHNRILYYTDYIVKTIEASEQDKINAMDYAKQECKKALEYEEKVSRMINEKKWYEFWK